MAALQLIAIALYGSSLIAMIGAMRFEKNPEPLDHPSPPLHQIQQVLDPAAILKPASLDATSPISPSSSQSSSSGGYHNSYKKRKQEHLFQKQKEIEAGIKRFSPRNIRLARIKQKRINEPFSKLLKSGFLDKAYRKHNKILLADEAQDHKPVTTEQQEKRAGK